MPTPSQQITLARAHGIIHVLAVGVSEYHKNSGFKALKVCSNDAVQVGNAFRDVQQLNAAKDSITTLTSKSATENRPTRGAILREIHQVAIQAGADDRILFFFSGHGIRINEEFYSVPEDGVASVKSTLLALAEIREILNSSDAKQKIVVIDACYSGPDTEHLKSPLSEASPKFLADYMKETVGTALIASSTADQTSTCQSPDPKLSLFTYFMDRALRGEPAALKEGLLSLDGMYEYVSTEVNKASKSYGNKQKPVYKSASTGTIILGDFRQSLIQSVSVDIGKAPVEAFRFEDLRSGKTTDVLTEFKKTSAYSLQYIEKRVNQNIGTAYEEKFGKLRSDLCSNFGFSYAQVQVDDTSLIFPGGHYSISYEADSMKTGTFTHSVRFDSDWFNRPQQMIEILNVIDMYPEQVVVELTDRIRPMNYIPGLTARNWKIDSALDTKVEVSQADRTAVIEEHEITLGGFSPQEILSIAQKEEGQAELAAGIFALLSS